VRTTARHTAGIGRRPSTVFSRSRPTAANYLEVGDIDTNPNPAVDAITANTFTDGITLNDGTFVPLNQVRTRPIFFHTFSC
jgi:hypothetical protein